MSFTRHPENFVCAHCGFAVTGTGYTNHCPKCLWSKHVDVEPGDRAETCGGMMRPVGTFLQKRERWQIVHRCAVCGAERRSVVQPEDDWDAVVRVQRGLFDKG